ncbi:MAG TPA: AAA family ATPase, partial [Caulobacteraceae bacterium]
MADVFVSYARSTEAKAKVLAASLAEHGYDVWIDHELPNHRAYSEVIEEQIQAARAVLVIWSPDAAASEWVRSEANRGRHERKLVQVAVEKTRLPMPFDQIQCADLSGWAGEGDHPVWRRVLTNLADLIGRNTLSEIGPGASRRSATQERRHLTVLSCALAAGSEVASDLDPEERLGVDRAWRGAAMAAIAEAGGYLAKSDEEMVAWFGYPSAQEDAAERAVQGGLGVVRAVEALDGRSLGLEGKLAARVGIHAGTVVISPGASGEPEVFGDAPGVARAVQADALPGDVLITGEVHDLVSGLFAVEQALGEGRGLFRVRAATVSRGHGRGFARHGRTPFIGREDETRLLKSRWDRTLDGDGQFILITGEAGIGKSRLVDAFHEQIRSEPHLWVECGGGALFANTALYPVSDMLAQGLGWLGDETDEERLERLSQSLARAGMPQAEPLALVAEMLNLPLKDDLAPPVLPADEKRRRLMAALMNWVLGATRSQPVVLAIEDLHWIDPSTLELIGMLADQIATAPLMLLCTARPDFRSPWAPRGHHSVMVLNRLTARQTRVLVAEVAQGLPDDVVDTVIQRTDGVPLFAEELTRLMSGSGPAKGGIPATLLDSLAARLDQAGAGKQTAQFAAVLGREFSHELLAAISDAP